MIVDCLYHHNVSLSMQSTSPFIWKTEQVPVLDLFTYIFIESVHKQVEIVLPPKNNSICSSSKSLKHFYTEVTKPTDNHSK